MTLFAGAVLGNTADQLKLLLKESGRKAALKFCCSHQPCLLILAELETVDSFYAELKEIAQEKGCGLAAVDEHWADAIAGGRSHDELVLHDRVHPSEAGYRLMAEAVMASLCA